MISTNQVVFTDTQAPIRQVGYLIPTRYCWMGCSFCSLSYPLPNVPLSMAPDGLTLENLREFDPSHIDVLKIRGGLSLKEPFDYWIHFLRELRPRVHVPIHAFSAMEIWQFHVRERRSVRELLHLLVWAGVDVLGPGGSEILLADSHYMGSPYRLVDDDWQSIVDAAGEVGLNTALAFIVYPEMPFSIMEPYLRKIASQTVQHIEVKPFRPEGTQWNFREAPHIMEISQAVASLRRTLPNMPIYLNIDSDTSADALEILSLKGVTAFFKPAFEVAP